jgi:hypothetical protein
MRRLLRVLGLVMMVGGCASQALVPGPQATAIKHREQALAPHAVAIQDAIRQSGRTGALAFVDARDGRLAVLPGDTPADAWSRAAASGSGAAPDRAAAPAVLTFVYRADVAKEPEAVTVAALQEQEAQRATLAGLDGELRKLSDALAATRRDTQTSLDASRQETQKALDALTEELAMARKFMLQVAQLGYLNQDMNAENASVLKKAAAASQESSANSAKLAESMRQLSEHLAAQLKDLATRLDAIQNRISNVK